MASMVHHDGPQTKRRRGESEEAGEQNADVGDREQAHRGEIGEVGQQNTARSPRAADAGAAASSTVGFPREDGRWLCPFCDKHVSTKSNLAQHVRRNHEGQSRCQGEAMVKYLHGMSRWLCGGCLRTCSRKFRRCDCGGFKDSEISGRAPDGPVFRWPMSEGVQPTVGVEGEDRRIPASEPGSEAMDTVDSDLPSLPILDQVLSTCGPLVKYVPSKCRCLWAEVILQELGDVLSRNNSHSWTRLFMVAKCCLWQPRRTRGGRKHRRCKDRLPTLIAERLNRRKRGEVNSLWEEYTDSCQERLQRGQPDLDAASARRARRLASEGRYARACKTLTTLGVHAVTDDIRDKLLSLHPSSPSPVGQVDDLPEASYIGKDAVLASLQSFPKDTAPGPHC